jgi:hypothetical protein
MGENYYGPGLGEDFALHVSPEAMVHRIKQLKADRDRYARWVERLEQLHAQRLAEVASGEWPRTHCPCNFHTTHAAHNETTVTA